MTKILIRWKLNEVMARHRVKGKDLANYLGVSANAVSALRNALIMPEIGGERWEQICLGVNELSSIGEVINPLDLIEYVPDSEIPVANKPSQTSIKATNSNPSKNSTSGEIKSLLVAYSKQTKDVA